MKLNEPMRVCKICFKSFKLDSLRNIVYKRISICHRCFDKLTPNFYKYKIDNIPALSLYDYDDTFKALLYQFKGCYDIELGQIFIEQYLLYLRFVYHGYVLVPMPSSKEDDIKREFNHVIESFKIMNLEFLNILYKSERYKQSDQPHSERHKISKYLKVSDLKEVRNRKILLIDDVVTTGSTLKSAIKLIKKGNPKCIKILTLAKVNHH